MKFEIVTNNSNATQDLARFIATNIAKGDVILLFGNLGSGKTTFVQALIQSFLDNEEEITSPTFNLVKHYDAKAFPIWHYDLYRVKHSDEILELGLDDALCEGVTIIEWPQVAHNYLPEDSLEIHLSYGNIEGHRNIKITGSQEKWKVLNEYKTK